MQHSVLYNVIEGPCSISLFTSGFLCLNKSYYKVLQNLARWYIPKSSFCIIQCVSLKGFRSVAVGEALSAAHQTDVFCFSSERCSETLSYQLYKHLNVSMPLTSSFPLNCEWKMVKRFFQVHCHQDECAICYCCNRPLCGSNKNDVPIYFSSDHNPVFWSHRWKDKAVGLWVNSWRIHSHIIHNCSGLSVLVCMLSI